MASQSQSRTLDGPDTAKNESYDHGSSLTVSGGHEPSAGSITGGSTAPIVPGAGKTTNTELSDKGKPAKNVGAQNKDNKNSHGKQTVAGAGKVGSVPSGGNGAAAESAYMKEHTAGQIATPRKRGRPAKTAVGHNSGHKTPSVGLIARPSPRSLQVPVVGATQAGTSQSSLPVKRKSVVGSAMDEGLRRSSRASAESANKQIAELSAKRPKATSKSTTPSTLHAKNASTKSIKSGDSTPAPKRKYERSLGKYEVDKILDARFFVKWKGYSAQESTWEPAKNVAHCTEAIQKWLEKSNRK